MTTYGPVQPPEKPHKRGLMRVVGFFDTTGKVIAAVTGLVTAIVGVFALVNQLRGDTPTPGPSPSAVSNELVVADQVRKCEKLHQMSGSREVRNGADDHPTAVRSCQWPPPAFADPDGFTEISILMVAREKTIEADGDTWADRVRGPCQEFLLAYDYGKMGGSEHLPAYRAVPRDILFVAHDALEPWFRDKRELPFYPERNEVVVVHNSSYTLVTVRCIT